MADPTVQSAYLGETV
ncbi:hypothetical protein [Agromyces mangrovi Wang et al. 2018]